LGEIGEMRTGLPFRERGQNFDQTPPPLSTK
jgi:hypothetical protein